MNSPGEAAVLVANALITRKKSFACMICIKRSKTIVWQNHITDNRHIVYLEKFNSVFENLGKKVSCKICKSFIAWENVQTHAKKHHIVPWYEPFHKYKTFYDNHILKFGKMYYCYLCDKIFPEWSLAHIHTEEIFHQNLRSQFPSSVPPNNTNKMYKDLISFGNTPGKDNTTDCKICNVNLGYHSMREHIKDIMHKNNKPQFIEKLGERMPQTVDALQPEELALGTMEANDSKKNLNHNKILKPHSRGMICNFVVEPNNPSKREISVNAKTSEKASEMFDENWFNSNFPILNDNKSSLTMIPSVLAQSQNVSKVKAVDTPINYVICILDPLSKEVMEKKKKKKCPMPKNQDFPNLCCLICSSVIPRHGAIDDHLRGQRHAKNQRKYGCDNIRQTSDNEYYCKSCDYNIVNFENVYRHVSSKEHLSSFTPAQMENGDATEPSHQDLMPSNEDATLSCQDATQLCENTSSVFENSSPPHQDITSASQNSLPSCHDTPSSCQNSSPSCQDTTQSCQSSSCIFIEKRNAKKSFCHVCDENPHVFTKNINDHITAQRHIIALKRYGCDNIVMHEEGTYRCICCKQDFENLQNVYLHIKDKKHMSSMIKLSLKEDGGSHKKKSERSVTPEKIYQPPLGNNLLSDYIVQQIPTNISDKIGSPLFQASQRLENVYQPDYIGKRNNGFYPFNRTPEAQSDIPKHSRNFPRLSFHNSIDVYATNHSTNVDPRNSIAIALEIQKQPELSSIVSSMASELTRLLEPFEANKRARLSENKPSSPIFNEKQCEMDKNRDNKNSFNVIRCPICGISIVDLTGLHSHMAQHLSEEFVSNKRPRYRDNSSPERAIENGFKDSGMFTEDEDPFSQSEATLNGNACLDNELPVNGASSNVIARPEIDKRFPPPGTTPATFLNIDNPQKMQHYSPRRVDMKKVIQTLNFDKDFIYDMTEKLADLRLGLKLCLVIDSMTIYCLVCRKTVTNSIKNYIEHLYSLDHCEYLEIMERDNAQFEKTPDEFSDLDLAQEYMQEISDNFVRCFICDRDIANNNITIEQHIYDKIHERTCEQMRANAIANYDDLKSQIHCDWYSVQKYWCVPCLANMDSEMNFVKHLESRKHAMKLRNPENYGKKMIYDFCQSCALLWYGYRMTWSYHCEIPTHKWLSRDGHFAMKDLPKFATNLLTEPERFVEDKIKYLDEISGVEAKKLETLIKDIENAAKMKFSKAKAYAFGSRVSGLGLNNSDIDVFLDCRNMYDGRESTESQILYFMTGVHQCLSKDPQSWDVEELLTNCRSPIIRAFHRSTQLKCDISFEHGLAVENTKLIRTFNHVYPSCRKLILILKQWLDYCDLLGSGRITSYALYWYVIFYLQKESILPSVATLIAMRNKSQIIAGWETGVSHDFTCDEADGNLSIKELLRRFFKFYANFDFRFDVACPLLGEVVEKRDFLDPWNLLNEMKPYQAYLRNSKKPERFRIDSAMCIQDPFDLQHNLTKAVHKSCLNRFRTCCYKSLDLLCSL